jgi:phage gpG-like protein
MTNSINENVEILRSVSNNIESDVLAKFKFALFPGWHETIEGNDEKHVREAAKAILANNITADEGTYVSRKSLAALIHYVADMLEEDV